MSKTFDIETIQPEQMKKLEVYLCPKLYQRQQDLIYEGQIPHVGFLLIEGEIIFTKRKKIHHKLKPGQTFGVNELLRNYPLKYTATIIAGSKVYILDKSTILELKEEERDLLDSIRIAL